MRDASNAMGTTSSGLRAENLGKSYPTRSGMLVVLREVSLELRPGDSLAIMGPSGSGKSTLLSILGTLELPTAGTLSIQGRDPFALPERQLAGFRNRHIGLVFQDHHLLPQCNALENVLIPTLPNGDDAGADARARQLLQRVGLTERLDHLPSELSGGERQRVAIARALINQPTVLLADEPTGNLDRTTAETIAALLLDLHREQNTILVVVTHNPALAERCARRCGLVDGRLDSV